MEVVAVICAQFDVGAGRFQRIGNTEKITWFHKFLKYNNVSNFVPHD